MGVVEAGFLTRRRERDPGREERKNGERGGREGGREGGDVPSKLPTGDRETIAGKDIVLANVVLEFLAGTSGENAVLLV